MNKFFIDEHTTMDKSFRMFNDYISFKIDYDDVNHPEVDAVAEVIAEILDKYWDDDSFMIKFKQKLTAKWEENKYNLQSDYDSFEDFLISNGYPE